MGSKLGKRLAGVAALALAMASPAHAGDEAREKPVTIPVTIHAGQLLDGKGGANRDMTITVADGKIVSVEQGSPRPADYEFGSLTVLPGLIDTHVHITKLFNNEGRATDEGLTDEERALKWAENVWITLMGGFTTVQSVGSDDDFALRAAIANGRLPGPRLLTSGKPFGDPSATPEQIRAYVREAREKGADVIKIFASKSSREGGGPTLTDAQLGAACGEARRLGLRTWVHAHAAAAVRQASEQGCYAVTHGRFVTQDVLDLLARNGTYLEPSWGVVQQNYMAHVANYVGIGNYTQEALERMLPYQATTPPVWHMMLATRGLKILSGTDAVAGAEGHNVEEIIWRVDHGQAPMDAIVDATSTDAEALQLGDRIGTIAPGMEADIIAVGGDPLQDITALRDVRFVMKGGKVYKHVETPDPSPPIDKPAFQTGE